MVIGSRIYSPVNEVLNNLVALFYLDTKIDRMNEMEVLPVQTGTEDFTPSGSGKSTVAKLAARFWDPCSGKITLGGVDISTVDPETLLKYFSIVFQDVVLFNTSVMENIRIGRRDATDDEVREAGRLARCDGFVQRLPQG